MRHCITVTSHNRTEPTAETGDSKQFDISKIDFDLLRREFAKAKKKELEKERAELEKKLEEYQSQQILLCEGCKYQSRCLADRYFNPNILTKTICSGHKNLIKLAKGK